MFPIFGFTKQEQVDYSSLSDREIVELWLRNNDVKAKTEIYMRHREKVISFAYRLVGNKGVAEDIFHDAFVLLLKEPEKLENIIDFKKYIAKIVINLVRNLIRKQHDIYDDIIEDESINKELIDYSEEIIMKITKKELQEYISSMKIKYREALILYIYWEFSREEVAEIMNISIKSAEGFIDRGYKQVKDHFYKKYNNV